MRLIVLAALLAVLMPGVRAEAGISDALLDSIGFDGLESLAGELDGPDLRRLAREVFSGKLDWRELAPEGLLKRLGSAVREGLLETLASLALPVLASLLLRLLLSGREGPLTLLCRLACACALIRGYGRAVGVVKSALELEGRVADALAPVLAAALALTGSSAASATVAPLSALCADLIEQALLGVGLPLCGLAAAVAVAGNLSDGFRLERLFRLIRRGAAWTLGLMLGGFGALLVLEGRVAAAQDTLPARTLQGTLPARTLQGLARSLVPIIGGELSGATGALAGSVMAARSAVGISGIALAVAACAEPLFRLAVWTLSVKLAAAVIEPAAETGVARIASDFGDVAELLLAICAAGAVLVALLAGGCLSAAGGIVAQ